jgi:RND family efflux transporter MFP subunit
MQPSETPDDTSRREQGPVSTEFDPDTGRRLKKVLAVAAVLLVLAFVIVTALRYTDARAVAKSTRTAAAAAPPVDVITAHPVTQGQSLVLPGETAAWYDTTLYARVSGYVASWRADIGDQVRKGDVLATLETPELDAERSAAEAQLKASKAEVDARRAEAEFSRTTNERWRDAPRGVVSEQERESKKADFQSAEAKLFAAQAQVALDQSRVMQYRALTEFKRVIAPFDGTITERKIDIGNLVTAGSTSSTTPLYRLAATDPLRIFVNVPQSAAGELMHPGVAADIRAAGAVGGGYSGKIARSAESLDPQARTLRVEVDMPNPLHALVPGMYVNVAFQLPPRGLVAVPAAALIFRPGSTEVARVGADGKVQFQVVSIARDDGGSVELGSGVQPGDRLVLNISSQIAAGQSVAAQSSDPPQPQRRPAGR